MRVHRIPLPMGARAGDVNAWLLPDPPVTLVDCGLDAPGALDALRAGFRGAGLNLGQLEQILLTHAHADHHGLAGRIASVTGCRVIVHREDLLPVRDPAAWRAIRLRETAAELRLAGVPPEEQEAARRGFETWNALVTPAPKAESYPGDVIEAGGALAEVHHLPGHSAGAVALQFPREKALFTGDVLLQKVVTGAVTLAARERGALARHLKSLEKLLTLPPVTVYPGHGEPFSDLGQVVGRDLAHHARRSDRIRELLAARPQTAWDLTRAIHLGRPNPALATSEVLGHLHLLEGEGIVKGEERDGVVVWTASAE